MSLYRWGKVLVWSNAESSAWNLSNIRLIWLKTCFYLSFSMSTGTINCILIWNAFDILKFAGDFWWHVTVILRLPTIDSSQSYLPSSISHRFTLHPLCARRASNGMGGTIENDNQCTGNKTNENKRTNVTICSYHLYNHSRLCNGFKLSHVYTRLLFVELTPPSRKYQSQHLTSVYKCSEQTPCRHQQKHLSRRRSKDNSEIDNSTRCAFEQWKKPCFFYGM